MPIPFPPALVPTNTIFNVTSAEVDRNHQDGYYQNWNVAVGYDCPVQLSSRSATSAQREGPGYEFDDRTALSPIPPLSWEPLQSRRPYPAYGRIRMWMTDGESDYHSSRPSTSTEAPGGFTFRRLHLSKLNDSQQGGLNASRARRQNPRSLEGEYAPRPTINASGSSSDMSGNSLRRQPDRLHRGAPKGWQIGGIGVFNSGSPLFINQDRDTLNVDSKRFVRTWSRDRIRRSRATSGPRPLVRYRRFHAATPIYGTSLAILSSVPGRKWSTSR